MQEENPERPVLQVVPAIPEQLVDGRDELNFAEFPLGTIAERLDPNTKTLHFEDQIFDRARNKMITRKLTITGSDEYGLPTSTDDEVLLALIQLSKLQKFKERTVYFSRYQLLKLLNWPVTGQSYQRIDQALNRWIGVTLYYQNAWRCKINNDWVDEKFHILERVKIYSQENEKSRPKPKPEQGSFEFAASFFVWNEALFNNFTHGNLKSLDYSFVIGLDGSISRRLYRFLDKRFHHASSLEFELKNLCYEHIGLSRKSPVGDLKRKLGVAIEELVSKGFLQELPKEQRFRKIKAGIWHVLFERAWRQPASEEDQKKSPTLEIATKPSELTPIQQKLVGVGVTVERTEKLSKTYPEAYIGEKLEVLEFLLSKKDPKVSKNPAGFLIRSIEDDFQAPTDFVSSAKRKERAEGKAARIRIKQERLQKQREREELREKQTQAAIEEFWKSLTPEKRALAEQEAIEKGDVFQRNLMASGGAFAGAARQSLLNNFALSKLSQG